VKAGNRGCGLFKHGLLTIGYLLFMTEKKFSEGDQDEPQYRVRSEKSGGDAVHKPEALKPRRD
jgi:hypothetical protein